jgi:hypothetical protein
LITIYFVKVYAKSTKDQDITAEEVVNAFKKKFPKEKSLDDVFGSDSYYDEGRKVSHT